MRYSINSITKQELEHHPHPRSHTHRETDEHFENSRLVCGREQKDLFHFEGAQNSYLMFKWWVFSFCVFPDQDNINVLMTSADPFESSAPHNVAPEVQFGSVAEAPKAK